jgi:hypothetical protein
VKAAVDQAGQLFGDVSDTGTKRPVMLMHYGEEDKPPKPADAEVMKEWRWRPSVTGSSLTVQPEIDTR